MSSKVFFFPPTPPRSPYYNLAIEESIALHMVKSNLIAGIRLWKNPDSIILGLSENPYRNIKEHVVTAYETEAKGIGFGKNQNQIFVISQGEPLVVGPSSIQCQEISIILCILI